MDVTTAVSAMSCRSMALVRTAPGLLGLASDQLESLSIIDDPGRKLGWDARLPELLRLTGLTRLVLIHWDSKKISLHSLEVLRQLHLQELVLIDCQEMELDLFTPDALTTLQKLHVEEPSSIFNWHENGQLPLDIMQRQPVELAGMRRSKEVAEILFQLPNLYQLSGLCNLFAMGMKEGLRNWEEASLLEGFMVPSKGYHRCSLRKLKVWTKPQSSN